MKKTVIQVLAVLWLAALLRLTVFRDDCFSHGLFSGRIEWAAFAYYAKLARIGYWRYFAYLFAGNLVWFMPVGVLVRAGREARPLRKNADKQCLSLRAALLGFLLSLGIETAQFVLGSGVSELDDLILNTVGALLGYALACLWYNISKNMKSPIDKKPQDIDNRR